MELIAKERDRLLQRTARFLGIAGTIVALISLSIPKVVPVSTYLGMLPFVAVLIACHIMVARRFTVAWAAIGILVGLGALIVARLPFDRPTSPGLPDALV